MSIEKIIAITAFLTIIIIETWLWRCEIGLHCWKSTYGQRGTHTKSCALCGKIRSEGI